VFEDPKVKAEVTAKVEAVGPDCIYATNTSTLPITGAGGGASTRPNSSSASTSSRPSTR
jgi:3-hydroxyacyl-CoA dehydrogenase/enoyl-CoA hydratase/3-hydroxybutyryl-CoA epimerase